MSLKTQTHKLTSELSYHMKIKCQVCIQAKCRTSDTAQQIGANSLVVCHVIMYLQHIVTKIRISKMF